MKVFHFNLINKKNIKRKVMSKVKLSEETIIRFYDIDVDGDGEDITVDDIETTLGQLGWSEEQTPADLIEEIGSDYISDECGWCINGYNWKIVK
jgi:hypothetical protein